MPEKLIEPWRRAGWCSSGSSPLGAEPVPLRAALGRVLAADVESADPVPGFDNSSMDGFAVRAADTAGGKRRGPGRAAPRR